MSKVEVGEVFNNVYDRTLAALRVTDAGTIVQKRLDYDGRTDDNPVYAGFGVRGLVASDDGWLINKITYEDAPTTRVLLVRSAVGTWDARASLTYS